MKIKYVLVILIGLSIPTSTALTNILCPLALLFILVEGQYTQKLSILSHNSIAITAILLVAIIGLGFLYTSVSFSESVFMLNKYREFFYIPMFILLFQEEKTRKFGLYTFLAIMGITLFLSYFMAITGIEIGKGNADNPFVFKNHITQNLLMALATYFVAIQAWQNSKLKFLKINIDLKWLYNIIIVMAIYNILFMSAGRTGYLILLCLILVFFYQVFNLKGILIGGLVLLVVGGIVYNFSGILQNRIDRAITDIQSYQDGNSNTSVGIRLEFYKNSLALILKQPILGSGTGSFSYEYNKLHMKHVTNPHNDYLMIAVQWGMVGLGLFILLLYLMWRTTYLLDVQISLMAQGLVVTIVIGCLVNSLWLDNTEGHIFAY
ncbi:O-antigen ligase family protein, partial [Thiotrichales bacterium HSG1]|nr:O-antigen ligase family protein [Thiotrichales bacterium HSG1]